MQPMIDECFCMIVAESMLWQDCCCCVERAHSME